MYHHKDAVQIKEACPADQILHFHEMEALGKIMNDAKRVDAVTTASAAEELRDIIQTFKTSSSNIIRPVFNKIEREKPVETRQEVLASPTTLQTISTALSAKQLEADVLPDHFRDMASRLANMQNVVLTRSYLTLVVDIQNQIESLSDAIEKGRSEEKLRRQSSDLRARMMQASQNFPTCQEPLSNSLVILDELTLKLRSFEQISYGLADDYMDAEREAQFGAALNAQNSKPVSQVPAKKEISRDYDEPVVQTRRIEDSKNLAKPISEVFSSFFKTVQPYMPSTKHCIYGVAALVFIFPAYQAVMSAKTGLNNFFSKSGLTYSSAPYSNSSIAKSGRINTDVLTTGAINEQKPSIAGVQSPKIRTVKSLDVPVIPPSITDAATVSAIAGGDPVAMYDLGMKLREGRGIERDQAAALNWFKASSELGHIPSTIRYAKMLEKGEGTIKDVSRAMSFYQRAADKGSREATHALAALYASGTNGVPDFKQAFTLFDRAARAGNVDSQYNLGVLYAAGQGVKVNLTESYKWFAIAAQGGDKNAATSRDEIARQLDPQTLANAKAQLRKINLSSPVAEMALATEAAEE